MRFLFLCLVAFLPQVMKRFFYRVFFGYELGRGSRIGLSFIFARRLVIGEGARIGHLNVVKSVPLFEIAEGASIGSYNFFAYHGGRGRKKGAFLLGRNAVVTSGHYFDLAGEISIGPYTTIAGKGSQFWTHGIDINSGMQSTAPLTIGSFCLVCTAARVVSVIGLLLLQVAWSLQASMSAVYCSPALRRS
jgi:hypothetical protein